MLVRQVRRAGLSVSAMAAAAVMVCGGTTWGAEAAATQPAVHTQAPPPPAAVKPGAVQEALRHIATLPRPGSRPTAASQKDHPRKWSSDDPAPDGTPSADAKAPAPRDTRAERVTFGFVPVGPYGYNPYVYHGGRGLPDDQRRASDYRYFDGQPGRYGYGWDRYFGDDYGYNGATFRYGFNRGYDYGTFVREGNQRTERLLVAAGTHMSRGLELFRASRFREAADAFRLASDTNQGDPAARLYAAHAHFAIGRYRDAVRYLRRALELQPKVAMLRYDIRDDYGDQAQFNAQLAALDNALSLAPQDLDRALLMGYVRLYTNDPDGAYQALSQALQLEPGDALAARLIEGCLPPDVAVDAAAAGTR